MLVDSLNLKQDIRDSILARGIKNLNPPQEKSVKAGLLDGKNILLSSPTASGKTFVAELAFLKTILEKKRKALYVVPLKALASEKYEDFKHYESLGLTIAMSVGDLDSSDIWLSSYDLLIVTVEKLDSLLRHSPLWINDVGLVVADEIHLLNDESRGPTLEVVLTKLKDMRLQVLGLSATVSNSREMASWLKAELVESDYRPVVLHKGVWDGEAVRFQNADDIEMIGDDPPEIMIADETVESGKQALVFANSRRNSESIAEKTSLVVKRHLSAEEKISLAEIAEKILRVPSQPTKQCKRLSDCVKSGAAFHHAGLQSGQRALVEDAFKKNLIKVVSSTPTLAAGVNLPAYRVIIRDYRRFHPAYGSVMIPVLEYEQMSGRAGRPKYDKEGQSILIAKTPSEAKTLFEKYIEGEPEEIISKLSVEPVMRSHILSLITTHIRTEEQLEDFFSKTFYMHQYEDMDQLRSKIERTLAKLKDQGFIGDSDILEPTKIGARVSQLYLDPDTAFKIIASIPSSKSIEDFLLRVCDTREIYPPSVSSSEISGIELMVEKRGFSGPDEWSLDYDNFLSAVKLMNILEKWMQETGEDAILEDYGMAPGELKTKIESADWLLYSCQELALLLGEHDKIKVIRKLRTMLKYGIKEELVPLVKLKNIGRVRARSLFNSGYKTIALLRKATENSLSKIVGEATAKSIKEQLGSDEVQKTLAD